MATPQRFPILILGAVIFSVSIVVDGSTLPRTTNFRIVPIEKTSAVSNSGIGKESEDISPSDCSRGLKTCLSLCCPDGKTRPEGSCLEKTNPLGISFRNVTVINGDGFEEDNIPEENYHVLNYDPCDIGWMRSLTIRNFRIFKNGSIYVPDFNEGSPLDFEYYCLLPDPKSSEYLAKVCRPYTRKSYYIICCMILAALIMLAIFFSYTVVPELRNLHGLIFRSYLIAIIGAYMSVLGLMFTIGLRINIPWFSFSEFAVRYFCGTSALWLNVMSINIWRSFRGLRQRRCRSADQEKRTFICYTICTWVSPVIIIAIFIALGFYLKKRIDKIDEDLKQWMSVGLITGVYLCNIFLYTSTALNIRRQKKDTANLIDVTSNHYKVDEQWFNLYVKLFVIMGGHVIMWAIMLVWPTSTMIHLLATLEVLQGILIFVIFIWKDNVKQSLREQFSLSRMNSIIFFETTHFTRLISGIRTRILPK